MTARATRVAGSTDSEALAAAVVGVSAAVLMIVALDVSGALRTILLVGYLVFVPGLAATRAAGYTGSASMVSLAVVISLGIDGTVSMALYAAQRFDPMVSLILVVVITLCLVFVERLLASSRPLTELDPPTDDAGVAPTHR